MIAGEADEIRSIGANDTVKRVLTVALYEVVGLTRLSAGLELRIRVPASTAGDLGHLPDLNFELSQDDPISP